MDKWPPLFDTREFAAAFGAATRDASFRGPASAPAATVWLEAGEIAAGAGIACGSGQLNYQGMNHAFGISGLTNPDVPGIRISATGIVRRLSRLGHFAGNYASVAAEERADFRASAVELKNDHGVRIKLIATNAGQRLEVSANGVRIRFKGQWRDEP